MAQSAPKLAKASRHADKAAADVRRATRSIGSRRSSSAQASADNLLGHEVRSLRTAKGLSLKELADKASLSIGMVSQIERGLTSPSIRSIKNLAAALDVPMSWFFHEAGQRSSSAEAGRIVRANGRRMLRLPRRGVSKDLLTPDMSGQLEMLMVTIDVDGTSGPELYTHAGEECGLVLRGTVELHIDKEVFVLNEGDSFRFPSTTPHRFRNAGHTQAQVVWVMTPPLY